MRLNDRERLDLRAERKIVDMRSMRYRARKKRKWRTAVHSGYVHTYVKKEGGQHNGRGKERKRADPLGKPGCGVAL